MLSLPTRSPEEATSARYRLVAIDLDGTVQPDGSIHSADGSAMRTAHALGVKVVLVSSRPPQLLQRYWAQLGLGTPVIALNGALVYDFPTHRHLMGQAIEREVVEQVLSILSEVAPRAAVGLECGDKWATSRLGPVAQWRIRETGIWPFAVGDLALCLDQAIYQVWVDAAPSQLEALRDQLSGFNLAIMHYTDPARLLLRSAAASRGWALSALASHLEVPQHQVMAIGDGGLDRSLLQAAAFTAVISGMEKDPELTEGLTEIATATGVAEALERYLVPAS